MTIRQTARPKVLIWPDGTRAAPLDVSGIVESFNTSKTIDAPTGRWSLRLLPSMARGSRSVFSAGDYERFIRQNAVVSIGWDMPGGIMLGLVDAVNRQRPWGGGTESVSLQGADMGKLLVNDSIVRALATVKDYDLFVRKIDAVVPGSTLTQQLSGAWGPEREDGSTVFTQATLREVVSWILDNVTTTQVPLLSAVAGNDTGTLGRFMNMLIVEGWNDGRIQSENLWSYTGTIWNFLRSIIDEDFYELFVDSYAGLPTTITGQGTVVGYPVGDDYEWVTTPTPAKTTVGGRTIDARTSAPRMQAYPLPKVVLVLRPKPFDEPALQFLTTRERIDLGWRELKTAITNQKDHVIPSQAVLAESMSLNRDIYSYYNVTSEYDPAGSPIAASLGLFYPAIDLLALQRHGYRAYEGRLTLLATDLSKREEADPTYVSQIGSEVLEFRNRLFNWYRLNPWFEEGTITVAGSDTLRVGDPVFLPWKYPMRSTRDVTTNPQGMRYYCTGTQHSWTFGGPYTTTLQLTRGHNAALIEQAQFEIEQAGAALGMPSMIAALPDTKAHEVPR